MIKLGITKISVSFAPALRETFYYIMMKQIGKNIFKKKIKKDLDIKI